MTTSFAECAHRHAALRGRSDCLLSVSAFPGGLRRRDSLEFVDERLPAGEDAFLLLG